MIFGLFKKKVLTKKIDPNNLPRHIGIIMDGNGRWAKKRHLPRNVGHRFGAETLEKIVTDADDIGIKAITAYAFSTENWKRPKDEVNGIMSLLKEYLDNAKKSLGGKNVRVRIIGNLSPFSDDFKQKIAETEEFTKNNDGIILNIALNYGGRDEIVCAVNECIKNGITKIIEEDIEKNLFTKDSPPVDLIIRPSGEYRLSNFLLWQSSYSEFWFSNVLWPDFKKADLVSAIIDYQRRNRRFGGV